MPSELYSLVGKRLLVTGASSGIGRATAILASQLGATLVLTGRRADALEETRCACAPGEHLTIAGDLGSTEFVASLCVQAGKLDGLVHAAGISPICPIGVTDETVLNSALEVNYLAFCRLMRVYSGRSHRNGSFSAVVVSSVSSSVGWSGGAAYCGSKGAVSATVRALALELATKGVRVNAVAPSNIRTPLFESGAAVVNDEAEMKALLMKQPLGLGEPIQVAAPICFLLSEAASFITGAELPVDGGYLAQ